MLRSGLQYARHWRYLSPAAVFTAAFVGLLTFFFEVWRVIFYYRSADKMAELPAVTVVRAFIEGLRGDLSVASYAGLVLFVLTSVPGLRRFMERRAGLWVAAIIAAVYFLMCMVDLEFYRAYNARLNGLALIWWDTPGIVIPMLWRMFPVIRHLILFFALLIAFCLLLRAVRSRLPRSFSTRPGWVAWAWGLPMLALLSLGARGRIEEKSPFRWGVADFSEYDQANLLALNPAYTFMYDLAFTAGREERLNEIDRMLTRPGADSLVAATIGITPPDNPRSTRWHREVRFDPPNPHPPNVVLVIMESFGATRIGCLDNRLPYDLTPNFDSLSRRGLLFTDFYSCGEHTYAGLFSTLTGFPHLFDNTVVKVPPGHFYFHSLPAILRKHGYRTMFFTTHDPHFDNMQGFVRQNGVAEVHGQADYPADSALSSLGVPDHEMFDHFVEHIEQRVGGGPFFAILLTASNHGPWAVPDVPFGPLPDTVDGALQLNAFKYSDWALGRFLNRVLRDPAFANTVIAVTGDNGIADRYRTDLEIDLHATPLLILNTDWSLDQGRRIDRPGSQMDILATVMGLVRLDYDDYAFGQDLLSPAGRAVDFVPMSERSRFGFVEGEFQAILRTETGRVSLYRLTDAGRDVADSLPEVAADYARKAAAFFETPFHQAMLPIPAGR